MRPTHGRRAAATHHIECSRYISPSPAATTAFRSCRPTSHAVTSSAVSPVPATPSWHGAHIRSPRSITATSGAKRGSDVGHAQLSDDSVARAASACASSRYTSAARYASAASSRCPRTNRKSLCVDVFSSNGAPPNALGVSASPKSARSVAICTASSADGGELSHASALRPSWIFNSDASSIIYTRSTPDLCQKALGSSANLKILQT